MLKKINAWAKRIKQQVMLLWFAYKHPECPFYVKALIGVIVIYALSPIDLIPDFIPILGYLDEAILLPILITLALQLIPQHVIDLAKQDLAKLGLVPAAQAAQGQAPAPAATQGAPAKQKPTIPVVPAGGQSPVRQPIKTMDDLKKAAAALGD